MRLDDITICPRLGVRELRESGWRTRAVDKLSASYVNQAAWPADKAVNDTLGTLVNFGVYALQRGTVAFVL